MENVRTLQGGIFFDSHCIVVSFYGFPVSRKSESRDGQGATLNATSRGGPHNNPLHKVHNDNSLANLGNYDSVYSAGRRLCSLCCDSRVSCVDGSGDDWLETNSHRIEAKLGRTTESRIQQVGCSHTSQLHVVSIGLCWSLFSRRMHRLREFFALANLSTFFSSLKGSEQNRDGMIYRESNY